MLGAMQHRNWHRHKCHQMWRTRANMSRQLPLSDQPSRGCSTSNITSFLEESGLRSSHGESLWPLSEKKA